MEQAKPRISIAFCTQCQWLLRSAWMAQELISTFGTDLGEVALLPGTGGVFEIRIDGELVWERRRDGGFPVPKSSSNGCATSCFPNAILATSIPSISRPRADQRSSEAMKASSAGSPALSKTRPSLVRRQRMSSAERAHSCAMR